MEAEIVRWSRELIIPLLLPMMMRDCMLDHVICIATVLLIVQFHVTGRVIFELSGHHLFEEFGVPLHGHVPVNATHVHPFRFLDTLSTTPDSSFLRTARISPPLP